MNWEILIAAIMFVESAGTINPAKAEGDFRNGVPRSIGALQIQKAVIDDVRNFYPHTDFTYEDRKNIKRSKMICRHYLAHWGNYYQKKTGKPATYEILCRIWNGGPMAWKATGQKKINLDRYEKKVMTQIQKIRGSK